MFSKDNSSVESQAGKKGKDVPLRKSDRRHLRERVLSVLQPTMDDDKARLDIVFLQGTLLSRPCVLPTVRATLYLRSPSEEDDSEDVKTSWPYTDFAQVVWIEVDHGPREEKTQIPSIALLSILPCFLKSNNTNNSDTLQHGLPLISVPYVVSKYLCRGAHLMKSGMRKIVNVRDWQQLTQQQQHPVVAVVIEGNPQPIAVGWLAPSIRSEADFGPGIKGEGVHIVTCYGDDIWKQQRPITKTTHDNATGLSSPLGAVYNAGHYGNLGFVDGKYVLPLVMEGEPDLEGEEEEEEGKDDDGGQNLDHEQTDGDIPTLTNENDPEASDAPIPDQVNATFDESGGPPGGIASSENAPIEENEPSLSQEDILHEAVCKALVRLSPKKDLPMNISVFYAQHVLNNRREGTTIQLKQTRYKKFGPYLQEQMENGLLRVGPDAAKKDPLAVLIDYDQRHADLRPFLEEAKEEKTQAAKTEGARMVLLDLFAVPNHFVKLLRLDPDVVKAANASSEQRRNTGLLTAKEMRAILEDYIARENLVHPQQPAKIVLDGPLTDALYKSKAKDATAPPTEVTRKELYVAWQAKMESAFALVQMPGSEILNMGRGKGPVVTMEVSKRNNKKFVTRVRGMEDFGISAEELQRQIAHRFACAASIEDDPQQKLKKDHFELVLQGNLVDEVEALLIGDESLTSHGGAKDSPFHIPKNAVEVILRKGVPARKGRASAAKKK